MSLFGDTLKQLRKARQLRQADLASALGLSQATIANYEQGIRFPDEAVLNQLADQLAVSIDQLLGRNQNISPMRHPRSPAAGSDLSPEDLDCLMAWLLAGDFPAMQAWLEAKLAAPMPVAELYVRVLQPVMQEVGRRWEAGTIDVYQEHAISEHMGRHLAALQASRTRNPEGPRFMGFAVSGNLHELGIRMVADILEADGWNSLFLGVNLPPASLLKAVRDWQPRLIGVSASLEDQLPVVQHTIFFLRAEFGKRCPAIMAGGNALVGKPELATSLGADAVVSDGLQARAMARSLIVS